MIQLPHIENQLNETTAFQQKIKDLVSDGKTLEEVQAVFAENEARLVECLYNEVKNI